MTLQDIFSIRVHHGYILQIFFAEMLFYLVLKKRDHFIVRLILYCTPLTGPRSNSNDGWIPWNPSIGTAPKP